MVTLMDEAFYRAQAALCCRIASNSPDCRIAEELFRLAAGFEAEALAHGARPGLDSSQRGAPIDRDRAA
jgi:hypothetical protein